MKKKELFILTAFIILKFVLQYVLIDPVYDLHRDEYLHLDQANHLAWGYRSVPPFTSWISYIIQWLGNSVFWVKFIPALFGAITIGLVWLIVDTFKGNLWAKMLAASGVLFSVLLRLNTLYQPNSFDVLSWSLVFYFFIKYLKSSQAKWIYLCAVSFALGFLNKYNITFLAIGLLPALLFSSHRIIFLRKELWIALAIVFLMVLPNLVWQWNNQFPVVQHLNELSTTQLVNVSRMQFLSTQPLFYSGSLLLIVVSLFALMFYKPFKEIRFLLVVFGVILVVYTYLRAKDYYAIGLYPLYIALGAIYVTNVLNKKWRIPVFVLLLMAPVASFAYMVGFLFPNKTPEYIMSHQEKYKSMGMLRWEDGKDHDLPQDYADMLGWRELAEITDKAYSAVRQTGETLVLCDNYGQAGAVNFYSQKGIRAVSFSADYIDWFDLDRTYVNLIRVINRFEKDSEFPETAVYFNEAFEVDSISNRFAREKGTAVYVFKGARDGVDISAILGQEIKELLKQ
ncbi:glycosyltransferase family 39 protein [Carboxylicivirga linearis]|uniref:Glycosyltransferase family 39 protein n=1 Tax=Carboxylicivirga linearis TaxID=1628157 RepID=A0ABS5JXT5_9BACT|nr:glycosyltransferase family 39 protein [Carboxylicivirga linearis]MBS2099226.1 glycosyltransferase family 39 protein [Carboxylicivirga linearis]